MRKHAEDFAQDVIDVAQDLQEHLQGSSPVGNVDDLEASCVSNFEDLVEAVEKLRVRMRKEKYAVSRKLC